MADFNATNYFARKVEEQDSFVKSKIQQLDEANSKKITELSRIASENTSYHQQYKEANKNSWASQLDLDPEGTAGTLVNMGASAASGISRMGGQLAALPLDAIASVANEGATQPEIDAYNNYVQGKASDEDMAVLNGKRVPTTRMTQGRKVDLTKIPTILKRFQQADNARQAGQDIAERFNLESIVHQGRRQQFGQDLSEGFGPAWDQTQSGIESLKAGEVLSGLGDLASGVGKLAYTTGSAAANNPLAAMEYAVENAPQLLVGTWGKAGQVLMGASNVGYATEIFRKGITEFQKRNEGQLPSAKEQETMAWQAASLAAAEEASDVLGLSLGKALKGTTKGAASVTKATEDEIRTGFKESLKNITKASTGAFGTEAATEGYQTALEDKITKGDYASPEEIFKAAVIGGLSGTQLTGGMRTLAEMTGATEQQIKKTEQEEKTAVAQARARVEAKTTGNVEAFLDPTSKIFSPSQAIASLIGYNQQENVTPEVREANVTKAHEIVTSLQERRNDLADRLDAMTPEGVASRIAQFEGLLAKTDPVDVKRVQGLTDEINDLKADQERLSTEGVDKKAVKSLQADLASLDRELAETRKNKDALITQVRPKPMVEAQVAEDLSLAETGNPEATQRLMVLSMASPDSLSFEQAQQLASNTQNGLTAEQREHFRVFAEARVEENKLKSSGQVSQDIYYGTKIPGRIQYQGIKQYNEMMAEAVQTGNQKLAERALGGLTSFARNHADKLATAQKAKATVSGRPAQILFNKNTRKWEIADRQYSQIAVQKNGGLTLNSPKLINDIAMETEALNKAAAALRSSYAIKFTQGTGGSSVNSVNSVDSHTAPLVAVSPVSSSTQSVQSTSVPNQYKGTDSNRAAATESTAISTERPEASVTSYEDEITQAAEELGVTGESFEDTENQTLRTLREKLGIVEINEGVVDGLIDDAAQQYEDDPDAFRREATYQIQEYLNEQSREESAEPTQSTGNSSEEASEGTPRSSDETSIGDAPVESTVESEDGSEVVIKNTLSIYNEGRKEIPAGGMVEFYKTGNPITQFTQQQKTNERYKTQRPLVAVKNFLSSWLSGDKDSRPTQFLSEGGAENLSEEQKGALRHFGQTARVWTQALKATLVPYAGDVDFKHRDMLQHFFLKDAQGNVILKDGKATVDENVLTAMAYGMYQWVLDKANSPALLTPEQVNTMHGYDKDRVSPEAHKLLKSVTSTQDLAIFDLGEAAVQALGIKNLPDAPQNLIPNLKMAMGSRMLAVLANDKSSSQVVRVRHEFNHAIREAFGEIVPKGPEKNSYVEVLWQQHTINKKTLFQLPDFARALRDASKGSRNVIDRLFGSEKAPRIAETKPSKFTQKYAKGTQQEIAPEQRKALQATQNTPHKVIPGMLALALEDGLGRQALLEIAGWTDLSTVHIKNRDAVEAQNQNLENQFDLMMEMLDNPANAEGYDQEFFVTQEVWKNFRAGFTNQSLNMQTSKIHRSMFAKPSWEVTIDLNNKDQETEYLICVAMNLGVVKTDQQPNAQSLDKFWDKYKEGTPLHTAVKAVQKLQTPEGGTLTSQEKESIVKETQGEGMLGLQALLSLAQYEQAKATNQTTFKTTMIVGADGKTNGPMLTILALGAMGDVDGMYTLLNRGGIYSTDAGQAEHYSQYYNTPEGMDLYEDLGTVMLTQAATNIHTQAAIDAALNKFFRAAKGKGDPSVFGWFTQAEFDAVQVFTQPLLEDGKTTKHGRNLTKTPLTAFNFGSSLKKSVQGMTDKFIEGFYGTIEDMRNGKRKDTDLPGFLAAVNTLIEKGNKSLGKDAKKALTLNPKLPIEALMATELSKEQEAALRKAFETIIGRSVKSSMENYFGTLIDRRSKLNQAIQASFAMYQAAYARARLDMFTKLMDSGDLAFRTIEKGKDAGQRVPLQDLSPAQEKEIRESLKDLLPVLPTAYSGRTSKEDVANIFMAKTEMQENQATTYTSAVDTGIPLESASYKGGKSTKLHSNAFTRVEKSPGVAGMAYTMHSTDSAGMHIALNAMPESHNVHDEISNSILKVKDAAHAINKSITEVLLNYSPTREALTLLEKNVLALAQRIKEGNLDKQSATEAINSLAALYNARLPEEDQLPPKNAAQALLKDAAMNAFLADHMRLGAFAKMKAVDQYTWEGGQFQVTDAIRKNAERQLDTLNSNPSEEALEALDFLTGLHTDQGVQVQSWPEWLGISTKQDTQEDTLDPHTVIKNTREVGLPGVSATLVVDALKDKLPEVAKEVAQGTPVVAAIQKQSQEKQVEARQALADASRKIPKSLISPWGDIGQPEQASNPDLLAMFEQGDTVTAKTALTTVQRVLKAQGDKSPTAQFYLKLTNRIEKLVDPTMTVTLVSKDTPEVQVKARGGFNDMGWYVADGDTKAIYLLGPDHVKSSLRSEVILHELLHSILAGVVDNPNPSFAAQQLITELQNLLTDARNYVRTQNLPQYQRATENIHELIAYGMLNRDFQKSVLEKLTVKNPKVNNELVNQSGLKRFVTSVIKFLGFDKSADKMAENGLVTLIRDVSGLLEEAGNQQPSTVKRVLSMASPDVNSYSTQTLYAGLKGQVSGTFNTHLQGLLQGIVDKLHGPFGAFKEERMAHQALTASDIFLKAQIEGVAPFASKALVAGFNISEKEAFVLEQVEATVRAALTDNAGQTTVAYRELSKLYMETYQRLKVEDFHQGDWATATPVEKKQAKAMYTFLFKMEKDNGDTSDYLSRFAALGLAHEQINGLLKVATARDTRTLAQMPLVERLQAVFERVLNWLNGKLTKTYAGQQGDAKLETLVDQLVSIEAKKRSKLLKTESGVLDMVDKSIQGASQGIRKTVSAVADSSLFKKSSSTFRQLVGHMASTVANDRVEHLVNTFEKFRNEHTQEGLDIASSIINEVRGMNDGNKVVMRLHRDAKRREGVREDVESTTTKTILESFDNKGKDLDAKTQKAMTNFFLRTDVSCLLNSMELSEIYTLLQNDQAIDKKIADIERQLVPYKQYAHFYTAQAKILGYYLATGEVKGTHLLKNASAITRMAGTSYQDRLKWEQGEEVEQNVEKLVDQLITLRTLQYVSPNEKALARNVLATEARRGSSSGIEFLLKYHKRLGEEAKDRLFYGSSLLYMKGYTSEIYNPHKEVRVADESQREELEAQGFIRGSLVATDKADPNKTQRHMYFREGGGLSAYMTGAFSLTDLRAKGSRSATDSIETQEDWVANRQDLKIMRLRKLHEADNLFKPNPGFDPAQGDDIFAAPVLDWEGNISTYNYLMSAKLKDSSLLDRDNRFATLLGRQAAHQFDKVSTPEQNMKVVKALKEQFDAEVAGRSKEYRVIGPNSTIAAHREIYQMLPYYTKEAIKAVWGDEGMQVRVDLLPIVFGYRKVGFTEMFDKDPQLRSASEQIFVDVATQLLGKKAMMHLNRADEIWQLIIKEIKDIYVIKNLSTLVGNIRSNVSELIWFGVPVTDIVRDHRIALKGATAYRKDSEALAALRMKLESGYTQGQGNEIKREIVRLEDALARNPVRELIEAGLMPTIVEDLDQEDIYSYKSRAQKQIEGITAKINPHVKNAAKFVYMTHDTPLYKALHTTTQLSDFVARYTLYQHLTTRKDNPMGKAEALDTVEEAFVNYDRPSHRMLAAANDRGLVMFTKYCLRIQKVIAKLFHDKPGRGIAIVALSKYFNDSQVLPNASFLHHMGNNPFSSGAFQYPDALDELLPVKTVMALFD